MCEFYFDLDESAVQKLIDDKLAPFLEVHTKQEIASFAVDQPRKRDRRIGPSIDVWRIVPKHWPLIDSPTKITHYTAVWYGVSLYSFYVVQTEAKSTLVNTQETTVVEDQPTVEHAEQTAAKRQKVGEK